MRRPARRCERRCAGPAGFHNWDGTRWNTNPTRLGMKSGLGTGDGPLIGGHSALVSFGLAALIAAQLWRVVLYELAGDLPARPHEPFAFLGPGFGLMDVLAMVTCCALPVLI
ncbi:MAG: hypothetical protein LC749_17805, partial [Actinobacteria bacterium]|nr:hypothetical protein [Actinomycetota bacterium]